MGTPRSFDDYPSVMNSAQVAEMLGHPVKQIQVWSREGRIPPHRDPGAHEWWFDRDEIVEWLASEATRVTPDGG